MKRLLLICICVGVMITACGKKEEPESSVVEPSVSESQSKEPIPEQPKEDLTGKAIDPLTGEYINEEASKRRPIAVVINNLHKALPQSGIGQADLYYEVLAEGEITRIVAVFQDFNAEKIGPVRSARDYFTYFALDNDALFVHHGGSPGGYSAIKKRGINDIDGMSAGDVFWRDKNRVNQPGMYEHSSYTSAENILAGWESRGFPMEKDSAWAPMFTFNFDDVIPMGSEDTGDISIPYSSYQISQFHYNPDTLLYERSQSGEPQIDELTGETLTVKNVIVQYASTSVIDSEGRRDVDLVGSGEGKFFTGNKVMDITWKKESYDTSTRWYDTSGNLLKLNKGKTWICVCPYGLEVQYEKPEAEPAQ